MALFGGILCLAFLPFLVRFRGLICGCGFSVVRQVMFWVLVRDFMILNWLGRCPAEDPFNLAAQVSSFIYFSYSVVFPLWNYFRFALES